MHIKHICAHSTHDLNQLVSATINNIEHKKPVKINERLFTRKITDVKTNILIARRFHAFVQWDWEPYRRTTGG